MKLNRSSHSERILQIGGFDLRFKYTPSEAGSQKPAPVSDRVWPEDQSWRRGAIGSRASVRAIFEANINTGPNSITPDKGSSFHAWKHMLPTSWIVLSHAPHPAAAWRLKQLHSWPKGLIPQVSAERSWEKVCCFPGVCAGANPARFPGESGTGFCS